MRVLRRFPKLEPALRDGRLCLSTLSLLGHVLTEDNAEGLLARAAFKTKAEVEHLVATIRPREAPRDGIRKLPESSRSGGGMTLALRSDEPAGSAGTDAPLPLAGPNALPPAPEPAMVLPCAEVHRPHTEKPRPISESEWSLRVTLDADCKKDLESLTELLSHKIPGGDLRAVLREAIRCGLEKHGNRKGAKAPAQKRDPKVNSEPPGKYIPTAVRRAVWERDGGCCSWTGPDGRRCGSRWQLEFDHIHPVALGGASTVDGLRLICRAHNMLHAEQVFGREHMEKFRRDRPG